MSDIEQTRRVVCAAVRAADGELLLGIRHYSADMHRQIEQRVDGDKFKHRLDEDQGFVDQYGEWMDREVAFRVALEAGQHIEPLGCAMRINESGIPVRVLYSEGLY